MSSGESVKTTLNRCKSGDESAAEAMYRRYARRIWALAESQIGDRLRRRVEADDIVQSVFRTFFRRTAAGEFSVDHSGALWHLLVRITLNKVRRQGEFHNAMLRSVKAEVDGDKLVPAAVSHEPTPLEAASLADELQVISAKLGPKDLEIFQLRLQGYSSSDIAARLHCSRQTVWRKLDRIDYWLRKRLEESSCE